MWAFIWMNVDGKNAVLVTASEPSMASVLLASNAKCCLYLLFCCCLFSFKCELQNTNKNSCWAKTCRTNNHHKLNIHVHTSLDKKQRSSDFRTPLFWIQITTPCISIGHNYLIFYSKSLSFFLYNVTAFPFTFTCKLPLEYREGWQQILLQEVWNIYIYFFYFYFETILSSNKKFHIYLIHILPMLIFYHISFFRRESTKNRERDTQSKKPWVQAVDIMPFLSTYFNCKIHSFI